MASIPQPDRKKEMKTRSTDAKSRVTLPKDFANCLVDVEVVDEYEVRIRKVVAIPEREAWLWQNPKALGSVRAGLEEARAGELAKGPDIDRDLAAFGSDEA